MRVRNRILITIALLILLGGVATILRLKRLPPEEATDALSRLQEHRYDHKEKESATADLVKLGDAAYPALAEALKSKDSAFDTKYTVWRSKLPPDLQGVFPERPSKTDLRRAIASSIHNMGPAASRALLGAIEYALEPSQDLANMETLRALSWSIPESPKAVQILSNWLANPKPGLPLFGMMDAREIWPQVPHLAPLLPAWLKLADTTAEAAEALSLMGTNAAFAIPLLIQVVEDGVAGGSQNAVLHMAYTPELEKNVLSVNKAAGLAALGQLGVATPEVLETLRRASTNDSPLLRATAANALGDLGAGALPALPHLLAHLDKKNNLVLRYQLEAVGNIGPGAKEAVPVLVRFSDQAVASSIPEGPELGRVVRWFSEPLPLHLAAAVSLGQVDPQAAKPVLPRIAGAFETFLPSNTIVRLRPLRADLLPLLEPKLKNGGIAGGALLAFQLLVLDPQNASALDLLKREMRADRDFQLRSTAARWYFHATRNTVPALEVFRETLTEVKDLNSQTPLTLVRELGPAARPLAPQVAPLLQHENRIMRMLAGKALRSIAPEAMPPIREE